MTASYWGVRLGAGGMYAEICRAGGFVAIGWEELGDLSWVAAAHDVDAARARLLKAYKSIYGPAAVTASINTGQLIRFARTIAVGDVVFAPVSAKRLVYVGRVTGAYEWVAAPNDNCPYSSRHAVEWLKEVPREDLPQGLLSSLGSLTTVFGLERRAHEAAAVVDGVESPSVEARPARDVFEHVRERLLALSPTQFEEFITDYLEAIGFDSEHVGKAGDGGIDVRGTLNAQGLAQVLLRVQVKRTRSTVGNGTVLKTRGALSADEQGAIITLGSFSAQARQEAETGGGKKSIMLIGGEEFAEMLLQNWGQLSPRAHATLGVEPREPAPLRDQFRVAKPRA